MKYKFTKNMPSRPGEMALVTYDDSQDLLHPYFDIWDEDGWYADLTENVPGIDLGRYEVVIKHDLYHQEWLKDLCEYIADSVRDVSFGQFGTKTKVIKLKPNWRELCIVWGGEQ